MLALRLSGIIHRIFSFVKLGLPDNATLSQQKAPGTPSHVLFPVRFNIRFHVRFHVRFQGLAPTRYTGAAPAPWRFFDDWENVC